MNWLSITMVTLIQQRWKYFSIHLLFRLQLGSKLFFEQSFTTHKPAQTNTLRKLIIDWFNPFFYISLASERRWRKRVHFNVSIHLAHVISDIWLSVHASQAQGRIEHTDDLTCVQSIHTHTHTGYVRNGNLKGFIVNMTHLIFHFS